MDKQIKSLLFLISLILVIVPMVLFPSRLGLPLLSGSAIYILYEMGFYGVVLFFFKRHTSLVTVFAGAAVSLVYRIALGMVFSIAVVIMYGINIGVAFSLGMAKYSPAVLLHVLAAPFVMRQVYLTLADRMSAGKKPMRHFNERPEIKSAAQEIPTPVTPRRDVPPPSPGISQMRFETPAAGPKKKDIGNQFEQAVTYIGESAAVKIALLVDEEGLILAQFSRCEEDPEKWAPLSVVLEGQNRQVLQKYHGGGAPEKIDIGTRNVRIILRRIEHVTLMVLAEQSADETILIRIAQAADMVRKYMSERYSPALFARVEERYVSNS